MATNLSYMKGFSVTGASDPTRSTSLACSQTTSSKTGRLEVKVMEEFLFLFKPSYIRFDSFFFILSVAQKKKNFLTKNLTKTSKLYHKIIGIDPELTVYIFFFS